MPYRGSAGGTHSLVIWAKTRQASAFSGRAEAKKESSRIQKNELTFHPHRRHRTEGTILNTFHPTEVWGPHRAGEKRPDSDGYGPLSAACTSEHLSMNGGSSPSPVGAGDTGACGLATTATAMAPPTWLCLHFCLDPVACERLWGKHSGITELLRDEAT